MSSLLPALTLLGLLFAGEPDGKARLEDLRVTVQGSRLDVSFHLVNAFDSDLVERIETGLPSGFRFHFTLLKDYKLWWDREMDDTTIQVFASYDAVSREYLVNYRQDGRLIQSRVVGNLAELEAAMTRFEGLHVFNVERRPRRRMLIRAKARLGRKNLLGIIPTSIETGSLESAKFRLEPENG
ncbi:MAG: DUF4390 domain-containing protein [Thermoanaerobaculia bacterium]|nr:DUF4390 domain-containing protein [Thermoanaerobaculia bacterium]